MFSLPSTPDMVVASILPAALSVCRSDSEVTRLDWGCLSRTTLHSASWTSLTKCTCWIWFGRTYGSTSGLCCALCFSDQNPCSSSRIVLAPS
ncbi:hypothetical protein KC19_VG242300 [Ceratodon purpureus]|uniref:Uncharacterized protein n=1 Tax=Ceratodon purpureus TaxID=3225 RepID=A0A8T0HTV2_CERPU|nr:hypothetical protein KC19_VG242300 [Ceratodon purpureus]